MLDGSGVPGNGHIYTPDTRDRAEKVAARDRSLAGSVATNKSWLRFGEETADRAVPLARAWDRERRG